MTSPRTWFPESKELSLYTTLRLNKIIEIVVRLGAIEGFSMVIERRRMGRTRVVHPVKILAKDASAVHGCIVDNLNTLGACIIFDTAALAALPPNFDLTFDNCRTLWRCHVIWQNHHIGRVGVTWKAS